MMLRWAWFFVMGKDQKVQCHNLVRCQQHSPHKRETVVAEHVKTGYGIERKNLW